MAQINPKITIRSVYFGMLLLSAAVMILAVRLTVASELVDSLKAIAEQGDATAQFNLGLMYDTGEGVPENDAEAVRWYRMAAEQGDANGAAQSGSHVSHWRRRSRKRCRGGAMVSHGRRAGICLGAVQSGWHVFHWSKAFPQIYTEAVRWYQMAAEQGECQSAAQSRSNLRERQRRPHWSRRSPGCS